MLLSGGRNSGITWCREGVVRVAAFTDSATASTSCVVPLFRVLCTILSSFSRAISTDSSSSDIRAGVVLLPDLECTDAAVCAGVALLSLK